MTNLFSEWYLRIFEEFVHVEVLEVTITNERLILRFQDPFDDAASSIPHWDLILACRFQRQAALQGRATNRLRNTPSHPNEFQCMTKSIEQKLRGHSEATRTRDQVVRIVGKGHPLTNGDG
ncbi:unnamed protein product [Strongylus vulgaris]|uniref:Uncharacterized protein n=1 Tax=Strongylus vulgaris TaxID=40348 RepID=A0A3P7J274_STRVU|nr:unnamed protein product [Strongylus vulgaris]